MSLINNNFALVERVLREMPEEWATLTTHRLDIYNEERAKVEFLEEFVKSTNSKEFSRETLMGLPTAFDYIRLGHPLSCILENVLAEVNNINPQHVVSFSSKTMPVMAVLRKNFLENKPTLIIHDKIFKSYFKEELIKSIYGYNFELVEIEKFSERSLGEGLVTLYVSEQAYGKPAVMPKTVDMSVAIHPKYGGALLIHNPSFNDYSTEVLHVRRRESNAMTPDGCLNVLNEIVNGPNRIDEIESLENENKIIGECIRRSSGSQVTPVLANCGLSIQYAVVMALIEHASQNHPGKSIQIIIPPNCYGGTNDQARRIARCLPSVEIVDLYVDGGREIDQSVNETLDAAAQKDSVPIIITEIPTNPRVEVPNFERLDKALNKPRKNAVNEAAVAPIFVVDQTFCPNYKISSGEHILSDVQIISYLSGSKFPSGGECTAGYCVANDKASHFMSLIEKHLEACDNQATQLQVKTLAKQLPSMEDRIQKAYINTVDFVEHIVKTLPKTKISFISKELAAQGFTPSVFSLDLPANTNDWRENDKKELNEKLIKHMINTLPGDSKHCVSYGQLRSSYWTIPATSTQGTTREKDKDYVVRVSIAPNLDLAKHKKAFTEFCLREYSQDK